MDTKRISSNSKGNLTVIDKPTINPLGIKTIAKAKNEDEVLQAFRDIQASFQFVRDFSVLQELQDLAKEIESNSEKRLDVLEKYVNKFQEAAMIDGVSNGKIVEGSVDDKHQKQVLRLRIQLIAEYQAKSVSEMMIIDMMINAYFRSLHASQIYSCLMQETDGTISYTQTKVNFMKAVERQIEIANKQFISSITLLKEMKQPPINIKVSGQAFVGQNQQFNKNA